MNASIHSALRTGALVFALLPFQGIAGSIDKVAATPAVGAEAQALEKVPAYRLETARAFAQDVLRPLARPSYGWFWGLDAAVSSWMASPPHASYPPAFTLSPALDSTLWERSMVDHNPYDVSLFSDRVNEWMATEAVLGAPQAVSAPAVVLTGPVTSNPNFPLVRRRQSRNWRPWFSPRVEAFIRTTVKENGNSLRIYVPVQASRGTGVGHYILAVVRIGARQPGADPRGVPMELDFYDSLMSGRTQYFSPAQELDFAAALQNHLRPLVGDEAAFTGPVRYLQVRTQMPSTSWCGRLVTLYFLADVLNIPYDEWYQERFSRILPSFLKVLEND